MLINNHISLYEEMTRQKVRTHVFVNPKLFQIVKWEDARWYNFFIFIKVVKETTSVADIFDVNDHFLSAWYPRCGFWAATLLNTNRILWFAYFGVYAQIFARTYAET